MPYSITTKDGITINNIPDNVDPQSDELKQRVADLRAGASNPQPVDQKPIDNAGHPMLMAFDRLAEKLSSGSQNRGDSFKYTAADAMAGLAPSNSARIKLQEMNGQITPEQADEQRRAANQINQSAIQGGSLGTGDEFQAGLLAFIGTALPESMGGLPDGKSLVDNYKGIRDEIRGRNNEFAEENPEIDTALKMSGGGLTGVAGGAKSVAGLTGRELVKRGALTGAGFGAVQGFGDSEANLVGENKDVLGSISDTGKGAAGGALAGFALSGAAVGIHKVIERAAKNKGVQNLLKGKNLQEKIKSSTNDEEVFDAVTDAADKVLLNGSTKAHKQAKAAIDAGWKKGDVLTVRTSSDATKKKGVKMINRYLRIYGGDQRHGAEHKIRDVVGDAAILRYNNLKRMNKSAGKLVDDAAKDLKNFDVNVFDEVNLFKSKLEDMGVNVNVSKKGIKANYFGSDFEGEDEGMKAAQSIINNILRRMHNTKVNNAHDVHRLKRYIDNNVSYGDVNKKVAEGQAENLVKELRHNLDKYLDNLSPAYDRANLKYSDTISIIKDVESLAGKNGVDARTLGMLHRRTDSNAVSSGRVHRIYRQMDEVSQKYGLRFKDSVGDLNLIANSIEDILPNVDKQNSFRGQGADLINKANELRGRTATDVALDASKNVAEKLKGDPVVNQIKAYRELLISNTAFQQ